MSAAPPSLMGVSLITTLPYTAWRGDPSHTEREDAGLGQCSGMTPERGNLTVAVVLPPRRPGPYGRASKNVSIVTVAPPRPPEGRLLGIEVFDARSSLPEQAESA